MCVFYSTCLFQANSLRNGGFDKSIGNLLYHIATRYKGPEGRINLLVNYVCAKKLTSEPQATGKCVITISSADCIQKSVQWISFTLTAAFDYLKNNPLEPVDIAKLDEACGVGVVVTRDQILEEVKISFSTVHDELIERRYRFNVGKIMSKN